MKIHFKHYPLISYFAIGFALLNELVLKKFYYPFFHFYLNDFVFPIIVIPLYQLVAEFFGLIKTAKKISITQMITYNILFVLIFEYLGPKFHHPQQSDAYDILAYVCGSMILYLERTWTNASV